MQADLKVVVDELIDLYNNPEPIEDCSVTPLSKQHHPFIYYLLVLIFEL